MSFVIAPQNMEELNIFYNRGVREFLIRISHFSRQGRLNEQEALLLIESIRAAEGRVIIEWDILMEQYRFDAVSSHFKQFMQSIPPSDSVVLRVQDLGAMKFCKEQFPAFPIQLNLETGHRNLPSLHKQIDYLGEQLDRVVLSFELSKDKLRYYREQLNCPLEILFHGRIPLFYSPRKLLTPVSRQHSAWIEMNGESEESPHKGFPLVENEHGTFMYNVKELSLVDVYSELKEIGINFFRFELSAFKQKEREYWFERCLAVCADRGLFKTFKSDYPNELIRGFYSANRSSILFEKLKNRHLIRDDRTYLGEVIEVLKPKHIAVLIKKSEINIGDDICYKSPEGKVVHSRLNKIINSHNQNISQAGAGSVVFLPYVKSISAKSLVTKAE